MNRLTTRFAAAMFGPALFGSVALAQCTAYIAPPNAPLRTLDGTSNAKRGDFILLLPAGTLSSASAITFHERVFTPQTTECFAGRSKMHKSGQLVFYHPIGNDEVVTFLASPPDLIPFRYDVPDVLAATAGKWGPTNFATIVHAAALAIDAAKAANFRPPEISNQATFDAPCDRVWSALVEVISEQKWQIESIDKSSGLITTKSATDASLSSMVCATRINEGHVLWLNIFVKAVADGVRVKVNATFHALREKEGVISCYSNGAVEEALFGSIRKSLAGQ